MALNRGTCTSGTGKNGLHFLISHLSFDRPWHLLPANRHPSEDNALSVSYRRVEKLVFCKFCCVGMLGLYERITSDRSVSCSFLLCFSVCILLVTICGQTSFTTKMASFKDQVRLIDVSAVVLIRLHCACCVTQRCKECHLWDTGWLDCFFGVVSHLF